MDLTGINRIMLRLTFDDATNQVTHSFSVNGGGFTPIPVAADQLPGIFDLFTQVDTSLERSQSGLGISLTLVKNLVETHDSTVEAHSDGIGQGSEFVVRLPIGVHNRNPTGLFSLWTAPGCY